MPIIPKQNYLSTISKLRYLWEVAMRLIASYEDFDNRLTSLEKKVDSISSNITSMIKGN
jgi:hypothetical protein